MRSKEKLWTIVYKISQAQDITSSDKPIKLHKNTIWPVVGVNDTDTIIEKLQNDDKIINLLDAPKGSRLRTNEVLVYLRNKQTGNNDPREDDYYIVNILPSFNAFKNRTYQKHTFGIDNISYFNLLKLLDVARDIKEKLEMTDEDEITINMLPSIVKFPALMPANSTNLQDQYMNYRFEAVKCMQKLGAVTNHTEYPDFDRFSALFEIEVDRLEFDQFFEKLKEKHKELKELRKDTSKDVSNTVYSNKPIFDPRKGEIVSNGKICTPPTGSIEYYICKALFAVPFGQKVNNLDVAEAWGGKETAKTVYDGHTRLNKRIKDELGIDEFCECKAEQLWIRSELFE